MFFDLSSVANYFQIILINVVLSGDNVVVIGMAAAGLAAAQRTKAIAVGIGVATIIRIVFSIVAVKLLKAEASAATPLNAGWNGTSDDALVLAGLEKAAGKPFNKVVYNGTPEKIQALSAGDIVFFSGAVSGVQGQLAAGTFRMLAQWGGERSKLVPDVPTAKEAGYDIAYDSWIGVTYSASVPDDIRQAATKAMQEVAEDPDFIQANAKSFVEVKFVPGDQVMDIWAAQEKQIAAVAEQLKQ